MAVGEGDSEIARWIRSCGWDEKLGVGLESKLTMVTFRLVLGLRSLLYLLLCLFKLSDVYNFTMAFKTSTGPWLGQWLMLG